MSIARDHPHIVDLFHQTFSMSIQPLSHLQILLVPLPSTCRLARFTRGSETRNVTAPQRGLRNGHAFDVFALRGPFFQRGMPLQQFSRLQTTFQERLQLSFRRCRWARPYLRSDSVWLSASRTRSRCSRETMFSVILLMSAWYVLSSLQKRTLSQICIGESGSSRAQ